MKEDHNLLSGQLKFMMRQSIAESLDFLRKNWNFEDFFGSPLMGFF